MHRYCKIHTELGDFRVACSSLGITAIRPAGETPAEFEKAYSKRLGTKPVDGAVPAKYKQALLKAVRGQKTGSFDIDWSGFTPFQQKVLKALMKVPAGKVQSYAWLARRAGFPKAARAVGNVMAQNPVPFLLPCHRIVPSSGGIGNYGLGKKIKRELLLKEGAAFE